MEKTLLVAGGLLLWVILMLLYLGAVLIVARITETDLTAETSKEPFHVTTVFFAVLAAIVSVAVPGSSCS